MERSPLRVPRSPLRAPPSFPHYGLLSFSARPRLFLRVAPFPSPIAPVSLSDRSRSPLRVPPFPPPSALVPLSERLHLFLRVAPSAFRGGVPPPSASISSSLCPSFFLRSASSLPPRDPIPPFPRGLSPHGLVSPCCATYFFPPSGRMACSWPALGLLLALFSTCVPARFGPKSAARYEIKCSLAPFLHNFS